MGMIELLPMGLGIGCFAIAFVLASLVEYWVHRLMHKPLPLGERHRDHHRRNEGQGVLWEFLDYIKGTIILLVPMFFISLPAGIGWSLGAVVYAAFSSYAHQLQHDNPTKCFWMKMPVHYVHHKYNMWHHNFGLGVDWWDHVFGTYKVEEWLTDEEQIYAERSSLHLKWW
jgi:sterol desaturase/sphingolipid hydroxylase (fatty acid hydroxylase superfamily)